MKEPEIHQLVHTLSYGDAISGEVLALQRCLQEMGHDSKIFAINVHPKLKGMAHDYRDFSPEFSGEVVLHYSLGSPLNALYLGLKDARRSLIYHNLTPADWFDGINPRIVADIEEGRQELPSLLSRTDRILADSAFNASEIASFGFEASVLELPIDPARWSIQSNAGILSLMRGDPAIHLLHVGRLAPNKCVEDIIKIFYFLHHHIEPMSKLWLVGIDIDTELYSYSLKRLAYELKVDHAVNFVGCLADSELKAMYETCSVYLCMSEHEGFCLPVIEAMHFGLPVVAYESSALPDTVGSGGILLREKKHPQIAELVHKISQDESLRNRLRAAGMARVPELSYEKFQARIRQIFGGEAAAVQSRIHTEMPKVVAG